MNKKQHEKELEQNELATWSDRTLGHLKPHLPFIGIIAALALVGFALLSFYIESRNANAEIATRTFSNALANSMYVPDAQLLADVHRDFPEDIAGLWALQMEADFKLRQALRDTTGTKEERKTALDEIRSAKNLYEQIAQSEHNTSSMLQRRSLFGVAYASESAGEFDVAKTNYEKLIAEGDKSAFYEAAKRGFERSGNESYVALFNKFRDWEDSAGPAPGAVLPSTPNIDFPDLNSEKPTTEPAETIGGGDFKPGSADTKASPVLDPHPTKDTEKKSSEATDSDAVKKTESANTTESVPPETEKAKGENADADKSGDKKESTESAADAKKETGESKTEKEKAKSSDESDN